MKKDSVMKKLFKYIGKYWILLILSIILAGISAIMPGLHVFIHTASVIIPPTIEKAAYSISLLGIL